jgi:DNA-binding SARP family transcriptional activator
MLLFARTQGQQAALADRLLADMGLQRLQIHPGYQLRLFLFGPFRLYLGREEVPPQAWQRKTARQLLLLFITQRHTLLHREQIYEMLWPEQTPENAQRDFKVAYNALVKVLEPERQRNAPSAFIVRDGSRYGLRPEADIWLDTAVFENLIHDGNNLFADNAAAALPLYREALQLYQGEYLQEYPYAEWCSEERERLLTLYLHTAERLATAVLAQEAWTEVIDLAQLILARDDCWENAYRLQMQAYAQLGNRSQVLRTYQRCLQCLQKELDIAPSQATTELYNSLK